MDEVYTCICKGQSWFIHNDFIRCRDCGREYKTKNKCPSKFNKKVKSYLLKTLGTQRAN